MQFYTWPSKACSCKISALYLLPRWTYTKFWPFFKKNSRFSWRKFWILIKIWKKFWIEISKRHLLPNFEPSSIFWKFSKLISKFFDSRVFKGISKFQNSEYEVYPVGLNGACSQNFAGNAAWQTDFFFALNSFFRYKKPKNVKICNNKIKLQVKPIPSIFHMWKVKINRKFRVSRKQGAHFLGAHAQAQNQDSWFFSSSAWNFRSIEYHHA
jgi:hypothetical protein